MHFNWNRSFSGVLASSVAALLATTNLYALPRSSCDSKPDVCCEEPKPGPFAFAYPKDMNLACPRDFYFHLDGLMMQAKEDGLAFAVQDSNGVSTSIANGKVLGFSDNDNDFDYNPGARFGVGFYLNHDAWNLDFNWTWLNITNYQRASTQPGGALIPLHAVGVTNAPNDFGLNAAAKWNSSFDMFDIRLTKAYHVSRYLILKPHAGIRAGWIDQHFSVDYSGVYTSSRFIYRADNDFWGVGTRLGFDSQWMLGKGFWLFGNFAASILYGSFDIDQHLAVTPAGGNFAFDGFDVDDDFCQNVPNMEMILGLGWGHFFDRSKYYISLEAAYEFHEFWDQLNIRKFQSGIANGSVTGAFANDVVARGNLTLNGFSLKLALDF